MKLAELRAKFAEWWDNYQSEHDEWRWADSEALRLAAFQAGCRTALTPPTPSRTEFERLIKARTPTAELTRAENGEYIVQVIQTMWEGYSMRMPAERQAFKDSYVQTVPDECDRIIWRGHYYHLPLQSEGKVQDGPEFEDGCDSEGFPGGCERFGHTPDTCPNKPEAEVIGYVTTNFLRDECRAATIYKNRTPGFMEVRITPSADNKPKRSVEEDLLRELIEQVASLKDQDSAKKIYQYYGWDRWINCTEEVFNDYKASGGRVRILTHAIVGLR